MKELYISPDLEILCFLPFEGIATTTETFGQTRNVDDGLSTEESRPGDWNTPVDPGESLH